MKRIIKIALILGLAGCQGSPSSSLTAKKLSTLSNEDLCRALGTYNNDGELVLKIYDELKRRPEKICPERCYILEKINKEQSIEFEGNNISYSTGINTTPSYFHNNAYQYIDPQHHKVIHNPRKDNKNGEKNEKNTDIFEKTRSLNSALTYKNELFTSERVIFGTKKTTTDKIDIEDEEMGKIMRECLKKHISKSQTNYD